MQKVLLDTCALIWLATGDARLSRSARRIIREAEVLCFSAISIWEIARKVKKGILEIPVSPARFSSLVSSQYGAEELPVNNAIALMTADLPEVHKDPADRFIIATALLNDFAVVTADHNFPAYGVSTVC